MEIKPYLETKYWDVILHENQAYLGYSIIALKSKTKSMSEITTEEWLDFHNIVKTLESTYKKCFNATMFNWTCLMNNYYKKKSPAPLVHWHFRPRYNHEVDFNNEKYTDSEFAHHYNKSRENIVDEKTLKLITDQVKKFL